MKRLFFVILVLFASTANATNYYISSTGNDANAGTSITAAWKTIARVNIFFSSMAAGDSILFKRGEIFYGAIIVNKSGSSTKPIIISAFGTGARPVITGLTDVTGWVSVGGNLWRSSIISTAKTPDIVTVNGTSVAMGRYPNANAASKGYLYFEAVSGKTGITDNELPASPNWTGGEIVIKPNSWTLDVFPISNHSGTSLTFTGNTTAINNNYGYFIQNHLSTLDQQNEWFFDKATRQLTMYSTASPANVKISTVDTVCYIQNRDYITVKDLEIRGANQEGISLSVTTGIVIDGCFINYSGTNAIRARASVSPLIQNNILNDNYNCAVELTDEANLSAKVLNNKIARTGAVPGKGSDLIAIFLTGSGHTIQGNTIDSTGFAGIYFTRGSNILVKNNVINTFCFVKSDGGGIYTWNNDLVPITYTNNKVIGNFVMNGLGSTEGTSSTIPDADGIYMDDNTGNVEILDNTVTNVIGAGMYIHNNFNMNVQGNTLYANLREQLNFTHNLAYVNGTLVSYTTPLRNVTLKNNILVSAKTNQTVFTAYSISNDLDSTGTTDSNYYARPIDDNLTMNATLNISGTMLSSQYTLASWKATYKKDAKSKKSPTTIPPYTINRLLTSNLFSNGQYTSNITGTYVYSPNSNYTVSWDNTGKISNGSLKVSAPTTIADVYTSLYASIGSTSPVKNYILRFSTVGSNNNGSLRVYLRKTASPFTALTSSIYKSYGTARIDHEFLFTAPSAESAASILIEFEQNSGTTYIDNVEFYEADVSMTNVDDYVKFVYNTTASDVTMPLSYKYIGMDSTVYNGTITLRPYSSKVLLKSGPVSGTLPVLLSDFGAKNINDEIQLQWVTAAEVNCSHYNIERSSNGRDFENAGRINSLNNLRQSTYRFIDNLPMKGVSYYRLAMVDKDGTVTYSKTVTVTVKKGFSFAVENAFISSKSGISLTISSTQQQQINFTIVDITGRVILSAPVAAQKGLNRIDKNIRALNTGIYYVKVFTNEEIITRPVLSTY